MKPLALLLALALSACAAQQDRTVSVSPWFESMEVAHLPANAPLAKRLSNYEIAVGIKVTIRF